MNTSPSSVLKLTMHWNLGSNIEEYLENLLAAKVGLCETCGIQKPTENSLAKKFVDFPERLNSLGVKRLLERALWSQGLRTKLKDGKKRHEFQTIPGFRKWFKIAGMKPINTEITMVHIIGVAACYYRPIERDILGYYVKMVELKYM